jgi:hypothetical protein
MQGHVISLALLSAINPTLLTAVAIILARPKAKATLTAFLVGGMLISIGFGVAALTILGGISIGKGHDVHISTAVEYVVGTLSLLAALLLPRALGPVERHHEAATAKKHAEHPDGQPSRMERMLERSSLPVAFLVGVAFNLPGSCYLVSIAEMADDRPGIGTWLPLVLLFNVIMFLPGELPLAAYVRNPDGTKARVDASRIWLRRHALTLARVMFVVVGVYLLARAILGI